ncbi:fumarylacetoacetate hydrolase family protein [Thioclava litoralis]|uniref:Fumarylacetoacetate hydrolase family protein n=1 Tax=Thioclava litoralis TaxID=3076557 RepID=A0ABZ1E032_9RHOB|nr:fumarylacetoacetate hydrolase family protein [Thioclava sp. FTW29]
MKLLRHGPDGQEKPGLLDQDGQIRDLSGVIPDLTPEQLGAEALARLAALDPAALPLVPAQTRLGAPVAGTRKVLAIGLNYADHAAETGAVAPKEPMLFSKAVTSICGPNDVTELPPSSTRLDWEVELGFVIGTRAKAIAAGTGLAHIAGYVLANDYSEREWQKDRAGQFVKGKSHDSFCPLGPWLVTRDEIADPQDLSMHLSVNGETRQSGSTATMIHKVVFLVEYLSQFVTLEPGDVILTGTPPGVGAGMKPPQFLRAGDVVELGIEGLGRQRHEVVAL